MEIAGQAGHTALFGIGLWLQCALAGAAIGAAVGAIQIYPGRWHPAWATKLVYWFSVPFFAGLATGVLLARAAFGACAHPLAGAMPYYRRGYGHFSGRRAGVPFTELRSGRREQSQACHTASARPPEGHRAPR